MTELSTKTNILYNKTIIRGRNVLVQNVRSRNVLVRNVRERNVQVQKVPWRNLLDTKRPGPKRPGGAQWLSGRVSDSGARGLGFETYRRRGVSLSKTLYSPKVLVNYPGSGGSVPT